MRKLTLSSLCSSCVYAASNLEKHKQHQVLVRDPGLAEHLVGGKAELPAVKTAVQHAASGLGFSVPGLSPTLVLVSDRGLAKQQVSGEGDLPANQVAEQHGVFGQGVAVRGVGAAG